MSFDDGKEFKNGDVINLLEKNGVRYLFFNKNRSQHAMMMVERFNRTIRDKLTYYMTDNKTKNWPAKVSHFMEVYNNSEHSRIK
jgi:hypothetical protein